MGPLVLKEIWWVAFIYMFDLSSAWRWNRKGRQAKAPRKSVMWPAWGQPAGAQHDEHRGQGSEDLGRNEEGLRLLSQRSGVRGLGQRWGRAQAYVLTFLQAHPRMYERCPCVSCSPQHLSGTLRGGRGSTPGRTLFKTEALERSFPESLSI